MNFIDISGSSRTAMFFFPSFGNREGTLHGSPLDFMDFLKYFSLQSWPSPLIFRNADKALAQPAG